MKAASRTDRGTGRAGWVFLAVPAAGTALYGAAAYLTGDPSRSRIPIDPGAAAHYLSLVVHALPASLVLLLGPLQFVPALRRAHGKLHRVVGRVYAAGVVVAAVAALFSAVLSTSGPPARVAFLLLAVAWLYSLARAYLAVRRGRFGLHRIWMIRNYALSFAAVALRAFLLLGMAARSRYEGLSFEDVYTTAAWASFLVCAGAAEWFIVHRTLEPLVRDGGPSGTAAAG